MLLPKTSIYGTLYIMSNSIFEDLKPQQLKSKVSSESFEYYAKGYKPAEVMNSKISDCCNVGKAFF